MTARILGIGTALPPRSITQADAAVLACHLLPLPEREARVVPELYRRAGVQRRGSVLLTGDTGERVFFQPALSGIDRGPGTGLRSNAYSLHAPQLAQAACMTALAGSGLDPRRITHLVTVSCTGFAAPGVDAGLITSLGLLPTVQRSHIGFMGCHGAINGLRIAKAFCDADLHARVLLCAVELCSLHFHYTVEPDKMVANALFADGAAAVVLGGEAPASCGSVTPQTPTSTRIGAVSCSGHEPASLGSGSPTRLGSGLVSSLSILACGSLFIADSLDAMTWRIGDHGFEMTLSPRVPELIKSDLRGWLTGWLDSLGMGVSDIGSWAVHPGGPRVLTAAGEALGLSPHLLDASRSVLADHGNMSSPTVLFILNKLREAGAAMPCVLLAFGPGLVIEAALVG